VSPRASFGMLLMGIGVGVALATAAWFYATGLRVDSEGTEFTVAETYLVWGGLAFGLAILLAGARLTAALSRSPANVTTLPPTQPEGEAGAVDGSPR